MRVNGEGRAPAREPTSSQFIARAMPLTTMPTRSGAAQSFDRDWSSSSPRSEPLESPGLGAQACVRDTLLLQSPPREAG